MIRRVNSSEYQSRRKGAVDVVASGSTGAAIGYLVNKSRHGFAENALKEFVKNPNKDEYVPEIINCANESIKTFLNTLGVEENSIIKIVEENKKKISEAAEKGFDESLISAQNYLKKLKKIKIKNILIPASIMTALSIIGVVAGKAKKE